MKTLKPIYIVDGNRTPFLKAQSKVGLGLSAAELGCSVQGVYYYVKLAMLRL